MRIQRFILLLFSLAILILPAHQLSAAGDIGVRLQVTDIIGELPPAGDSGHIRVVFEFLSGPQQGDTTTRNIFLWGHPDYDSDYRPGRKFVAVARYDSEGQLQNLESIRRQRDFPLFILFIIVSGILFVVARWEGVVGLGATLLTVVFLFVLLFPAAAANSYLFPIGLLVCLSTIFITIILVMRRSRATVAALMALTAILFVLLSIAFLGINYLQLDGRFALHSRLIISYLQFPGQSAETVVNQLIILGIILSCLGAVMDVAVVISSTIDEIVRDRMDISFAEAYKYGMNVGSKILSTMVNTLVFAYMGVLFPVLLGLQIFELSWINFFNYHFIGIEILRVCAGLIGLALTIPVTSLFSAWWCRR